MYKHKSMKEVTTQAHSEKKRRAKERLVLKMQGRNAAEKAPGIGIMLPGKVRRSRKYGPRYEFSESVPDLEQSDELLIDTSSPVKDGDSHSTMTSLTTNRESRPRKRTQLSDMIPMQGLIDKIIARRQITDRYLDDRYRRYRGRPSEEDKTPMLIRSYRPPVPPFAIQNNSRVRKFVFISPRRNRDRIITGPTSSIVVIEKPSHIPLLERDEDRLRHQKWNNRTQELDIKTWKPHLEYLHRVHHTTAEREDRHVRNYKLERQLGMKMEGQGLYSDSHFTTQTMVLPPIRVPCQPIFGDKNHQRRGESSESRKSACSSARSSKGNITLGDIDVMENENSHRNAHSRSEHPIEYTTKSGERSQTNEDLVLEIKGEEIKKNNTNGEEFNKNSGDESNASEPHKMEVRIPMGVPRVPTNTPDLPGEGDDEEEGDDECINKMETANRPKGVAESEPVDNNSEVDNPVEISVTTVGPFDTTDVDDAPSDSNNNSDNKPTIGEMPTNESELDVPIITMTCATPVPGTISRTNTPAPPVSSTSD